MRPVPMRAEHVRMTAAPPLLTAPDRRRPAARFPALGAPSAPSPLGVERPDASAPGGDPSAARVLWCGQDEALRAQVADHVAAAGCVLAGRDDPAALAVEPVLVIGTVAGLAAHGAPGPSPQRGAAGLVAVAGPGPVGEEDWRTCLRLGVRRLLHLPEESSLLLDVLGEARRPRGGALVLGVAGACGGAGASSTAARLAGAWARRGAPVVLVDADPEGGGLDLLVEAPASRGGAWEDVGRLDVQDGAQLREGLPVVDGVHLLAARADGGPRPERAAAALAALAPLEGVVVADLAAAHVPAALAHLDVLLLVVPSSEHALRAAARRLARWPGARERTELLVRRGHGPLSPAEVSQDLGLSLAGAFRDSPRSLVPLLDVRRRGADRLCARLVERWQEDAAWTR